MKNWQIKIDLGLGAVGFMGGFILCIAMVVRPILNDAISESDMRKCVAAGGAYQTCFVEYAKGGDHD